MPHWSLQNLLIFMGIKHTGLSLSRESFLEVTFFRRIKKYILRNVAGKIFQHIVFGKKTNKILFPWSGIFSPYKEAKKRNAKAKFEWSMRVVAMDNLLVSGSSRSQSIIRPSIACVELWIRSTRFASDRRMKRGFHHRSADVNQWGKLFSLY